MQVYAERPFWISDKAESTPRLSESRSTSTFGPHNDNGFTHTTALSPFRHLCAVNGKTWIMSTATNRHAADSSRRPPTTSGAKFRGPSSRVAAKERPLSSAEVIPEDSASNAAPRRTASEAHKVNGGSRAVSERQLGRAQIANRDTYHVRTISPVKTSFGEEETRRSPKERIRTPPIDRQAENQARNSKEKKALRRSFWTLPINQDC